MGGALLVPTLIDIFVYKIDKIVFYGKINVLE